MAAQQMPAVAKGMNAAVKHVASSTIQPTWNNTRLLEGNLLEAVRALKASDGNGVPVLGSGSVVAQLGEANASLIFQRVYRHPPEHVWHAISTAEGLRGWLLCTHAIIDGRVGGRMNMVSGPPAYSSTGTILAWEPPRVLEYEWIVAPVPEMPNGEHAIFR